MPIPESFAQLQSHAAPGLYFPPHTMAKTGARVLPAPHEFGAPASAAALRELEQLTKGVPGVATELAEFYRRWNGVKLCLLDDPLNHEPAPALEILPIEQIDDATLATSELDWMFDGLEDLYNVANYRVLALNGSEGTRLVQFVAGAWEGVSVVGKVFCVAMDPVLSFTEPVAESFSNLLRMVGDDLVAFLRHIGFCHTVVSAKGQLYGDVPERYIADTRDA